MKKLIIPIIFYICLMLSINVFAGQNQKTSYINQVVLILDWVDRTDSWIVTHLIDTKLLQFTHSIAENYVEIGNKLSPPPELVSIHPHILLLLENMERSLFYGARGDRRRYLRYRKMLIDESRIIDEIVEELHINIPTIDEP